MTALRREQGCCDWCFRPLGEIAEELNGGTGHPECVRFVYEAVAGPDAMPWVQPRRFYRDPNVAFLERLGREAVRLGIDPRKLATAVARARQ